MYPNPHSPSLCVRETCGHFLIAISISIYLVIFALNQRSPTFLAPGTSSVEDRFSKVGWGMVRAVTRAMGSADEALLARPPLTSCCAARFLTGPGLVPVRGRGAGDPCLNNPCELGHREGRGDTNSNILRILMLRYSDSNQAHIY